MVVNDGIFVVVVVGAICAVVVGHSRSSKSSKNSNKSVQLVKKKLTTIITQLHQINGTFLCCVFVVVVFVVVNEDIFVVVVVPSSLLRTRTRVFKKAFAGLPSCFYNYGCCCAITSSREYHCCWYVFLTLHFQFVCLTCCVFLFFEVGLPPSGTGTPRIVNSSGLWT